MTQCKHMTIPFIHLFRNVEIFLFSVAVLLALLGVCMIVLLGSA